MFSEFFCLNVSVCVCVWPICSVIGAITLCHHRWQPWGAPAPAGGTRWEKQPSKSGSDLCRYGSDASGADGKTPPIKRFWFFCSGSVVGKSSIDAALLSVLIWPAFSFHWSRLVYQQNFHQMELHYLFFLFFCFFYVFIFPRGK